jgi:hypothetical protein
MQEIEALTPEELAAEIAAEEAALAADTDTVAADGAGPALTVNLQATIKRLEEQKRAADAENARLTQGKLGARHAPLLNKTLIAAGQLLKKTTTTCSALGRQGRGDGQAGLALPHGFHAGRPGRRPVHEQGEGKRACIEMRTLLPLQVIDCA